MTAGGGAGPLRVLCAGDRFIRAAAFAAEVRRVLGEDVEVAEHQSEWPDVPFGPVDGVREAAGDPAELAGMLDGVDVLLTHLAPVTAAVLERASGLRVVGVTRGGPVNVDLPAASRAGVPVVFLPGRNLSAVAEFTVGVMIALPRGISASSRSLAAGTWDSQWFRHDRTGPELAACTVGLVGAGAVGLRVAELLAGFGTRVLAHDPYADPAELGRRGITPAGFDELLASSDVVSLHARLTDDTRHLMDAAAFAQMRPGAYLVNTARGELVDQAALLGALESGHLGGVATDVFDPEPPAPDDPLLARDDVLGTPHLAGSSRQVAELSVRRVVAEVAGFLREGTLEHCANPDWDGRNDEGGER